MIEVRIAADNFKKLLLSFYIYTSEMVGAYVLLVSIRYERTARCIYRVCFT